MPAGARSELVVVAGRLMGLPTAAEGTSASALETLDLLAPLPPPPDSRASVPDADLGIFTLELDAKARFTLPAAAGPATKRVLYFFAGEALQLAGEAVDAHAAIEVDATQPLEIVNPGAARA